MKLFASILLFAGCLMSASCFSQGKSENAFEIKGTIKSLKNDSVIVYIRNADKTGVLETDTFITTGMNDEFSIKGHTEIVRDAAVMIGGFKARKSFTVFIEKGITTVNGHRDSLDYVTLSGTKSNEEYTAYKKIEDGIYERIKVLQTKLKEAGDNKSEATRISNEMNACRDSIRVGRIRYISSNPGSPSSAIYLYVLQDNLSAEQLEKLYTNLTPTVKAISFVRMIPEKIRAKKRAAVGMPAPEFAAMDITGKRFSLSDYRGKYVLLEFWASWCVPCRAENPDLLIAYKKYQDKGFVVVGISLDDKKEKWEKAIEEDKLPWIHISELTAFDNKIAKLYGVQPIPDNFLIDPQGKIIARQLRGREVEERLAREIH
jgi:peroxiredoxin